MNANFFSQLAQGFANAHHEREQQEREDLMRQREGTSAFVQSALKDPNFKREHIPLLMGKLGEAYSSKDKQSLAAFNDVITKLSEGIPHPETDLPMPQHTITPALDQSGQPMIATSTPQPSVHAGGMESFWRSPQEQTQFAAEHAGALASAQSEAKLPGQLELAQIKNQAQLTAIEQRFQNRLRFLQPSEQAKHERRREELASLVAAQRGRMQPSDGDRVQAGELAMRELDNKLQTGTANASYAQTRAKFASPLAESKLATEEARRKYMSESLRIREGAGVKLPPYLISTKNRMEQFKNSAVDLASKADREAQLGNPEKAAELQKEAEAELQRAEDQKQTLLEMFPQFVQDNSSGGWPGARINSPGQGGGVAPVPGAHPSPPIAAQSISRSDYDTRVQKYGQAKVDAWLKSHHATVQ